MFPLKLTNIKGIDKSVLKELNVQKAIDDVKLKLGDNALLLVRPSGTESLIRVTISHEDQQMVNDMTDYLVKIITEEGQKR
jgi:phosphoglucosamine mutase